MGLAIFVLLVCLLCVLSIGVGIAACGVALVVSGIISIKKPGKIKFLKSKSLSIIMIITGAIIIVIGAAVAVIGIVYFGGPIVGVVHGF